MALNFRAELRNSLLDQIETFVGASAFFRIFTGAKPTSASSATTGTRLVSGKIPASGGDWMAAASGGTKAKSGTWSFTATGSGNTGYFRIYRNNGGTASACMLQGLCTGAGSDMVPDNTSITAGQTVTVNTFTLTGGNA